MLQTTGTLPKTPFKMILHPKQDLPLQRKPFRPLLEKLRPKRGYTSYILELSQNYTILAKHIHVTIINLPSSDPPPVLALLNLDLESLPHDTQHTTIHVRLAARPTIARHWKSPTPPTLLETIELTRTHYSYAILMAASSGKLQQHQVWSIPSKNSSSSRHLCYHYSCLSPNVIP